MNPTTEQLESVKRRYEVIAALFEQGSFPGVFSEEITQARAFVQRMITQIQEQVNAAQNPSSDQPSQEAPGVGDGGVSNQ